MCDLNIKNQKDSFIKNVMDVYFVVLMMGNDKYHLGKKRTFIQKFV